jgi:hypothetical protein
MRTTFVYILLLTSGLATAQKINRPVTMPATVIVPASDFLDRNPKGNTIADAGGLHVDWVFNNTAVVLNSKTNLMVHINVPEDGLYYVYAHSQGARGKSFKVSVGDKLCSQVFGSEPLNWKQGGSIQLQKGIADLKITRINPGSAVDVVVLSKNISLKEEDIKPYQLNPDVELIKEYQVPNNALIKFGDINGDKKTDFAAISPDWSVTMFDNSGKELWSYKAPEENNKLRSEFEAPGVLWDFDHDGKAEFIHWRFIDGKEWLVMANGQTGDIIQKVEWPTNPLPHVYNNFRLAIAKLTKGAPNELIVYTDCGGTVNVGAYNAGLKLLWQHTENRLKDNLGHYIYPIDLDGDGIDEVLLGSLLLDAKGKEIWNRFDLLGDNHDHADSYRFLDIDHDGKLDIVISNSETGVYAIKGMTKEIIWQNVAEHSQKIEGGDYLKDVPGPQVVVGGRTYGGPGEPGLASQLYWFSNTGKLLSMWPQGFPINGNPNFAAGNWKGKGKKEVFWYKFKLNENGEGDLYFPDEVYHMFDFTGRGAEEIITQTRASLKVYGSRSAFHTGKDMKADLNYLKSRVINHTHY